MKNNRIYIQSLTKLMNLFLYTLKKVYIFATKSDIPNPLLNCHLKNFNMRNKLIIFIFLLCGVFTSSTQAQNYESAIGAKLGYGLVASYKKFLNEKAAVDLFGGIIWSGGLAAGAYYELHYDIASVDRLQWYWGGGASFTTWNNSLFNEGYFQLGVSGVVGLDYSLEEIPLNLSIDWAPTIVIYSNWKSAWGNYDRFRPGFGSVTARYILN